jgi:peptidyl-prolyl cis-trans isomerase D
MLKFFGKRNRSRRVLLILVAAIMAVGIVIAVVPSVTGVLGGAPDSDAAVARVGRHEVTVRELNEALTAFGQQVARGQGSPRTDDPATVYATFGRQVLDNLIRQKLVVQLAEDYNLEATDDEVRQRLREMFNPWPGADLYRSRIRQAGYTVAQFEENLRIVISEEKVRGFITAAAQVGDAEVEEDYRRNKTNYNFRWAEVQPEKFREKVQPQEADLRAHFDKNKDQFRINTEQRRSTYIFVDQTKAGETITLTDDELRKDFVPERGVQRVRVSQIVLNIPKPPPAKTAETKAGDKSAGEAPASPPKPTPEDEVRKKANDIIGRARGDAGKPQEDFTQLAREFSQDAKTRAAGGDIGWVDKKAKRETDDPLNRVFDMTENEISAPIKKGDKFYILKVTERKIPTFEEAREQLLKEAQVSRSYTRAVEIATEAADKLKASKDPKAVAGEINARYSREVAMVKDSPFFGPSDSPKDLNAEFVASVFALGQPGDVADRLNVPNGFAVPQYAEKRDPHDPAFEEVKDRVEESYRTNRADEMALQQARELAKAGSPDGLKAAAEKMGLKTDERTGITGSDSFGPLTSEYDRKRVYALKEGEVTKEPIKPSGANSYAVVALISRKDPVMGEEFQKDQKSIRDRLLGDRKEILFSTFIADTQKRLKDEGKIEIFYDVIEAAIGPAQPLQRPGAPLAPGRRGPVPVPVQ